MENKSDQLNPPPSEASAPASEDPAETLKASPASAFELSEITQLLEPEAPLTESRPEDSTLAVRVQDLEQGKTADINPALLPGPRLEPSDSSGASIKLWLGLILCLLLAGAGAAYWYLRSQALETAVADSVTQPPTQPVPEVVAPELRAYLEHANGGDEKAMHMIALMSWNGLNVRQDRVKGLEWYRKAATAGDKAAQKELSVIEGK